MTDKMPIEGKVAEVLDKYSLAANIGQGEGVEPGMKFEVYEEGPMVTDPETGEELGKPETVKARLTVKSVKQKMSILETGTTTVKQQTIPNLFSSNYTTKQKKLETDEYKFIKEDRTKIKVGDPIRQVVGNEEQESDSE